ncbi:PKD domain-containing protein [Arthrobacter rhombi]|uniref:PKD domain-containing protein n=2 Tax=Arthrobacter rhombi TaxID=71253 RepID=UPI0035662423
MLAFNIKTGNLTAFAPQINGTVKSVAVSPDGTRLYVGGTFTSVNGQTRWNLAAFDIATGNLVSGFTASVGGAYVNAIAVTDSAVYVGGNIGAANGVARKGLAAFSPTGALLGWAPTADLQIDAMKLTAQKDKLIVAGRFSKVNEVGQRGLAALDLTNGALLPWDAPNVVQNGKNVPGNAGKAGIWALAVDENAVYGTGWVFADVETGNLEGTFSAAPDTGKIRWIADCHGDHYGVYSDGKTVYTTSHEHACESAGGVPQNPSTNMRHAQALTAAPQGTLSRSPWVNNIYKDWSGYPAPAFVGWWPDWYTGTATGMGQAGFSIVGNGEYMSVGGEFVGLNGKRQQGLARFSSSPQGGAKQGPRVSGANWTPSARSNASGTVRVSIGANWDRDDINLTYRLMRVGKSEPVATKTVASKFWDLPTVALTDTGLAPNSSQSYYVTATDGDGNKVTSPQVSVQVSGAAASAYRTGILDDSPSLYWPLGGPSSSTAQDWVGTNDGLVGAGVGTTTPGAVAGSDSAAATLSGGTTGLIASSKLAAVGEAFTTEFWFKTGTNSGGKLVGYGSNNTGASSSYDRHVYMANDGRLVFGTYPGAAKTVTSPAAYNDNSWHYVAASQGQNGMRLYVDGHEIASDPATTTAQSYSGYWRLGGDSLGGWPNSPNSEYFTGAIDEFAVYDSALTPAQVGTHYAIGSGKELPTASFSAEIKGMSAAFDASASTGGGGANVTNYSWDFGDGSGKESGKTLSHTYAEPGKYSVALTVKNESGLVASTTKQVTVAAPHAAPVASLTHEATGLSVAFDGTGSTASDAATIASYAWNFGDGESASGAKPEHQYAEAGTYTVTLVATDSTGSKSEPVSAEVTVEHAVPVAKFGHDVTGLSAVFDGSGSTASDGATVASYAWDFGDGKSATGAKPSHQYAAAGTYTVKLTVKDSTGAESAVVSAGVAVGHDKPVGSFTAQSSDMSVSVDASASKASDGATMQYSWDWGDGSASGTGVKASHTFAEAGSFDVVLTVTDSLGAVDTVTKTVTASEASADGVVASDDFNRDVSTGWGTADDGGQWSGQAGFSVADGEGQMTLNPAQKRTTELSGVNVSDLDASFVVGTDKVMQGANLHFDTGLHKSAAGQYMVKIQFRSDQTVQIGLVRVVGGVETMVANKVLPGYVQKAGQRLEVRIQTETSGSSTTWRAKAWEAGTSEPTGWMVSASDSEISLQGPGTISVSGYLGGGAANGPVVVSIDDLKVQSAAPVEHAVPVAKFGHDVTGLSAVFDGSGSTASDGATVASYAWDFGDGKSATGAKPSHQYAAAGTYTVKLTVKDSTGAESAVVSAGVAVGHDKPVGSFTAQSSDMSVSVDASASKASDGATMQYSWDWGDGSASGTGVKASHTFAEAGSFDVVLTVTDSLGAVDTVTKTVTASEASADGVVASDDFNRDVSTGWGTADDGGQWSGQAGFSVADGEGQMTLNPAQKRTTELSGVNVSDLDASFVVGTDKVMQGANLHFDTGLHKSAAGQYMVKIQFRSDQTVQIGLVRVVGGVETMVANKVLPGYVQKAGQRLEVRIQTETSGSSTTWRAKAWEAGTSEPTGWMVSASDSEISLQGPGTISVSGYLGGGAANGPVVVSIDDLKVQS